MSSPAIGKGSGGEEGKLYPSPLATHLNVVNNPSLFLDTLERFHSLMGTRFRIPVIGGKELDLHVLYVEVTRRSGYEEVVACRQWNEVGKELGFSATTTSASFALKKHYFNLLYHYEQVHFFQIQGPIRTPYAFSGSGPELDIAEYSSKPTNDSPDSLAEGLSVIGTIEGKFDGGYLVSVKLGSEVLKGVLYHPE